MNRVLHRTNRPTRMRSAALVVGAAVALSACGSGGGDSGGENGDTNGGGSTEQEGAAGSDYPSGPVTLTAPSDAGSGWDTTARALVEAMEQEGLTDTAVPVQNRPGATGCVWMGQMVQNHDGGDHQIAVTSTPSMSTFLRGQCDYSYRDVTMISTLIVENYMVVVPAESEYQTADDLLNAVQEDPQGVAIGASGDDQLPFALLVQAAGGDPQQINFIEYEGGGQQTTALLNGDVAAAVAGVSEFRGQIESGTLKGLTVLREEPLEEPMADIPTTVSLGYDVTLGNWRGVYGPPNMPDYAVEYWQGKLKETLDTPTWDDLAERNQWQELYLVGDEMESYLDEAYQNIEQGLQAIGATG